MSSEAERRLELLDYVANRLARPSVDEAMVVIPSRNDPNFVVPGNSAAARRSLLSYQRLRDMPTQAKRAVVAGGLSAGLWRDHLDAPASDGRSRLIEVLADELDVDGLTFAIGLARYGPFAKPVLQLFDPVGTSVGYAKVGWTPVSSRMVEREADVLARVAAADSHAFRAPQVLASFVWEGAPVVVTSPMPPAARRPRRECVPTTAPIEAIATIDGPTHTRTVGQLPVVTRVRDLASPDLADRLGRMLDRSGAVEVPVGRAHGDLVTWNAARVGDQLWLWDWEYSEADLPMGFDVVHGCFQEAVELSARPLRAALREGATRSEPVLRALGLDADQQVVVAEVHRLELIRRSLEAENDGVVSDLHDLLSPLVGAGRDV